MHNTSRQPRACIDDEQDGEDAPAHRGIGLGIFEVRTPARRLGHALGLEQLAVGVAAMVNGGLLHRPTLLRGGAGTEAAPRRVVSRSTSEKMRRLLRLAVVEGTGGKAAVKGYLVGGKTGTAEQVVGGSYKRKRLLASFVAAFPMHQPR